MKLIRRGENPPVKGLASSELICTVRTDNVFQPNAAVKVRVSGVRSMEFTEHYISRISRKGGMVTFHAFDRMRRTENFFDDALYNIENEPYNTSEVLSAIANQLGFAGLSCDCSDMNKLYYDEIHGKKCSEILELVSENLVGAWVCRDDDILAFVPFGRAAGGTGIIEAETEKMYLHSEKGPFAGVYGRNSATGEVFVGGSQGGFREMLMIKCSRMDSDAAVRIAGRTAGMVWRSFSCGHIGLYSSVPPLGAFLFGGYPDGLVSVKTIIYFTAHDVFASAETADICEDESDYQEVSGYEMRKRIEAGRIYGSTVMTERGIGFVEDREYSAAMGALNAAKYVFSTAEKGITAYTGIMMNRVPKGVKRVSGNRVEFTYDDFRLVITAEGEGDERTDLKWEVEDIE
ncbi:MAG: hypothetical protein ACI4KF_02250 [Huintestinicola sp.]